MSYRIRLYYSDRTEKWSVDVYLEEGDALIQGEAMLPYKLNLVDRINTLSGFWLEPISIDDNETFLYIQTFYLSISICSILQLLWRSDGRYSPKR